MLEERLAKLTKLSKKIIRPKKDFYLDPVKKKDIVKQRDNYREVESKLDYENMGTYQLKKQRKLKDMKKKKELSTCTFKPKLNKKSKKMVRNVNYVRPHDKELLRKKEENKANGNEYENEETTFNDIMKQLDIEEGAEPGPSSQRKAPKKKIKKIDEKFYDKQLKWLNRKQQVAERQRLEKVKKEYSEVTSIPKTNRKKNDKILGNRKKLMNRVGDETLKSRMKKEKLQQKYNKATFKPKINRNYNVKSKVKENMGRGKVEKQNQKNGHREEYFEPELEEQYEEMEEDHEYVEEEYEHQ
jgi:hypothetical protein